MRPLALVLVACLVLAGCSGTDETADQDGGAAVRLLCHPALDRDGERCNFEMTPDEGREGNEVTIAVNPLDPRNIVGGAKDYYPMDAGECVWDGVYVTHDGARSVYADRSFDGSPWRLRQGDVQGFAPNYASQFWCTTDPVAYFDVNGRLYYLLMAYQADPVTGSKTCQEQCPDGALNDWAFNRATQIVAVSDDGGDTFHTFTPVLEGSYPVNFHDKGWIAASRDGTIHVMWLAFFIPGNQYCRSTDEGQTFQCTQVMALQFQGAGQGSFLEVGTGQQVYALWTTGGVQMRRSFDTGATWDAQRTIVEVNGEAMPGLSPRDRRGGFPMLATDRNPQSPYADSLYVVWQDACNDVTWTAGCDSPGTGIYLSSSHDEGDTWSAPVRLSDDREAWRIFPAVSVSPGGVVDVSWMEGGRGLETPEGEAYDALEQAYAYSLDGGATFSTPFSVRDAGDGGWDPALCHHQNGMVFIGDYNDIDSSWQAAHPVWPDARHGVCDVYTATILRPMFAGGWDEAGREAALEWVEAHPV